MGKREYTSVAVTKKAEKSLRGGHPWVFGEEITSVFGEYENGDLVDVYTEGGKFIGTGFINDRSKIRVRLISTNANDRFDEAFFDDVSVMRLPTEKRSWGQILTTAA